MRRAASLVLTVPTRPGSTERGWRSSTGTQPERRISTGRSGMRTPSCTSPGSSTLPPSYGRAAGLASNGFSSSAARVRTRPTPSVPVRSSGWKNSCAGAGSWTILRPSMIYGSERDRNVHRLLRFLDRSPVFPVFGPGTNLWQPVYHEDCARGVFEALERPASVRRSYDLPGADPLAYLDLVKTAAAALGRSPRIVRLPIEPVRLALAAAERLRLPLPFDSGQVMRLREDKAYPYESASRDLDYAPRPFREGVALEVARLRRLGMVRS